MNSIEYKNHNEILSQLLNALNEDHLSALIDLPIDQAVDQYAFPNQPISTYPVFVQTISKFVQSIYQHGILLKQTLDINQAKSEAFLLLNEYQGLHRNGMVAAWIDVSSPYNGDVEPVLMQLKELVKHNQRKRYVQWTLLHKLSSLDWQIKCRLAKMLISTMSEHLPPAILHCEPEQLVEQIPSLIQMHLNSSMQIQKILA